MHVVLCNVLPGSGYRLRATSKIGEVSGHSSLLRGFGNALAQPCRARTRDRRCRWSGEGGHKRVEPSCLRLRRTTQNMRKPQEAISGTLAALRSIASSLIDPSGPRRAPGGQAGLPALGAQGCRLRVFPNKQLSEHDGHCMQPVRRTFPPPRSMAPTSPGLWPVSRSSFKLRSRDGHSRATSASERTRDRSWVGVGDA